MLLTELWARFVSVSAETIGSEIVNAQRQIVEALNLDRNALGRVEGSDSDERFVVTHTWVLPGVTPLPGYAIKDLLWFSSELSRGHAVRYSNLDDIPEEAVREREVVGRVGPRSTSPFPRKSGESDWGHGVRHRDPGAGVAGRHR
jgi:hypothetical protein